MSDVISMVVFSDGKSKELVETTQNCINSALDNCLNPLLEITVFEINDVVYERCMTVKVNEEFNYNKFANDFIKKNIDKSSLFLICNNDLVFLKNWLQPLINANYPIVSSLDPTLKKQLHIKNNEKGYINKYHFSSWCFMIDKQLWSKIKGFDEDFPFWYADDSLLEQLKKINIPPMIIHQSKVIHARSKTLGTIDDVEYKNKITKDSYNLFYKKYIK